MVIQCRDLKVKKLFTNRGHAVEQGHPDPRSVNALGFPI